MTDYVGSGINEKALKDLEARALKEYKSGNIKPSLKKEFQRILPGEIILKDVSFYEFDSLTNEFFGEEYDLREGFARVFLSWQLHDDLFKGRNHPEFSKRFSKTADIKYGLEKALKTVQAEYRATMDDGGNWGYLTNEGIFLIYHSLMKKQIEEKKKLTADHQKILSGFRPVITAGIDNMKLAYILMKNYVHILNYDFEALSAMPDEIVQADFKRKRASAALDINICGLAKKAKQAVRQEEKIIKANKASQELETGLKKSLFFLEQIENLSQD